MFMVMFKLANQSLNLVQELFSVHCIVSAFGEHFVMFMVMFKLANQSLNLVQELFSVHCMVSRLRLICTWTKEYYKLTAIFEEGL